MQNNNEYIEKLFKLLMKRFDEINIKLDRLARIKDLTNEDDLLDNQYVMPFLGITHRSLQRYKQRKLLPYKLIAGKSYYKKSDVLKALKNK